MVPYRRNTTLNRFKWLTILMVVGVVLCAGCGGYLIGRTASSDSERRLRQDEPLPNKTSVASKPGNCETEGVSGSMVRDVHIPRMGPVLYGQFCGGIVRGDNATYIAELRTGERLTVVITSVEDNALFDLVGPDGQVLIDEQADLQNWTAPIGGSYTIRIVGTRGNTSFSLLARAQ